MQDKKIINMPLWLTGKIQKMPIKYLVKYDKPKRLIHTHWHDYIEFQFIAGGKGRMTFNGNNYDVSRGDVFVLSHFDCHRIDPDKCGIDIVTLNVAHSFLDERTLYFLNASGGGIYCHIDEQEFNNIEYILKCLYDDMQSEDAVVIHTSKTTISSLVMRLLKKRSVLGNQVSGKMQKITAYISNNFTKNISLESIAKEFETSANYLGKQFKKSFGITYNDYINILRMRYACNLIASSEMTIKEVAHTAGYSSTEYFYSVFKKHTGITPILYRKKMLSGN